MKVAIDCRSLAWKHSGIARYLDNILVFLEKDKKNTYYLLSPFELPKKYNGNIRYITLPANELVYKYISTPLFIANEKIDVYWSPTHELPFIKNHTCKYLCTIHDVAFEHDMSSSSWKVKIIHMLGMYKRSAQLADIIFTDSYYSKKDIEQTYTIQKDKTVVTYIGIDNIFRAIPKKRAKKFIHNTFEVPMNYMFYVNTGKPKNLLLAFKKLLESNYKNKQMYLVCIGRSVTQEEDIDELAKTLGISHAITHIKTYVDDNTLNNLYAGADLFICPSYFEGFGLTPLEALKSGTPVIISQSSALPEIFQDAAYYCDPTDPDSIVNAIRVVSGNKSMQMKQLQKSKQLFRKYNWDTIGKHILDIFHKVASESLY